MKKKITSITAAILMSVSCINAGAYEVREEYMNDLDILGITAVSQSQDMDAPVSRAEALAMVCIAAGVQPESDDAPVFSDVSVEHWARGYIAEAYARGWVNGSDGGIFRPEDNVKGAEFIKMLVSALGYSIYADNAGGYPNGYMTYAAALSLFGDIGVETTAELDRGEVLTILYNAMDAPLLEIKYIETDGGTEMSAVICDGTLVPFKSFRTQLEADNQ